jgi:hypothetical protein
MLQKSRKLNRHHNMVHFESRQRIYESEDEHIQFHDLNTIRFEPGEPDTSDYPFHKQVGARVFRVASYFEDSCNVEYFHKDEW